jgi:tRNA U34 5-methylaminomethyl-2-thiouridine-forming methyltransferase MnmC
MHVWQTIEGPVRVFEMGFGTGLNAFLTAIEAEKKGKEIQYTALEKFPLTEEEWQVLNYAGNPKDTSLFGQLHLCPWKVSSNITPFFELTKIEGDLEHFVPGLPAHLVYYDAFAPSFQPELWTEEIFKKVFEILCPGGVMVTYCSKSIVRRAMMAAGFRIFKVPGPWGKREMVRAVKE